ncbi:MAG: hypothetical protein IPJ98_00455 [Bryobacterales bacterium]|nr:hypothetical protein [Bryobacterales bacterium]
MKNAHLRMGKLTFVRQTRDTITNVSVRLDRLVAEVPEQRSADLHLVSVFGGDQEISAMLAAAHEGLRLQVDLTDCQFFGSVGEMPIIYRSSLQVPGRKRPVRHAVMLSKVFFETTLGANADARRTVLYDDSPDFVLHRLAVRFGLPVLPEWGGWFHGELHRRGLTEPLVGLNCSPIAVKGTKLRMLRILSQGLRRKAIEIPPEFAPSAAVQVA